MSGFSLHKKAIIAEKINYAILDLNRDQELNAAKKAINKFINSSLEDLDDVTMFFDEFGVLVSDQQKAFFKREQGVIFQLRPMKKAAVEAVKKAFYEANDYEIDYFEGQVVYFVGIEGRSILCKEEEFENSVKIVIEWPKEDYSSILFTAQ